MKIILIVLGTMALLLSVDASMNVNLAQTKGCSFRCHAYCQQNFPNKPGCPAKCEAMKCSGN